MKNPFAGTGLRRYTRKHLVHDRDAARAEVLRLEGLLRDVDSEVIRLRERISKFEADAVDVSVERQLRQQAERKVESLTARLRFLESIDANENAITVPPMYRPVEPDETATHPGGIDVRTLRDALNAA